MPGGRSDETRTVTYSGGWFRIDTTLFRSLTSTYYNHPNTITARLTRNASGYGSLTITQGQRYPNVHSEPVRTAERRTIMGEDCIVWIVGPYRRCITDDGIEIAKGGAFAKGGAEATSIERRTVAPSEVRLPPDIFDVSSWIRAPRGTPVFPERFKRPIDVATEMKRRERNLPDTAVATRTFRRHYPWSRTEDRLAGGGRRLAISGRFSLTLEERAAGDFRELVLASFSLGPDEILLEGPVPRLRNETILGQKCTWTVLGTSRGGGGYADCVARDGVVLKEKSWGPDHEEALVAVRVERRPVDLSEVMPPPELLKRETWGLP
jgi:hypothetical protein